jgi:hypothetical protein
MSKIVRYEYMGNWLAFCICCVTIILIPMALLMLINGTVRVEDEKQATVSASNVLSAAVREENSAALLALRLGAGSAAHYRRISVAVSTHARGRAERGLPSGAEFDVSHNATSGPYKKTGDGSIDWMDSFRMRRDSGAIRCRIG